MIRKYIKVIFIYIFGGVFWLVLFSILQLSCFGNIQLMIDTLWTKQEGKHFVKSLAGATAFYAKVN